MFAKVTIIGNLGKDPEIKHLESGAVVANFSVATSDNYKDKNGEWVNQTEWHDIVLWGTLAERAEQSLKKGSLVYLEGKLTHRKWEDKEGNPRKTTEVVGNYFRILNRKEMSEGANVGAQKPVGAESVAPITSQSASDGDKEDLPF